ncbi:NAD(P)H-hydrate dehydratase [Omnitrophica bacterium]|nr:NAD(P)H-hydrate dehydratase [Candidatus Omnitrophota bacterium]
MVKRAITKIKPRQKDTHKGDYGHVFILAGSLGMTGAAYLASQSALLSGSGLVTLGIPKSLNAIMEMKLTEVMTLPLEETAEQSLSSACEKKVLDFAARADVLAIGPGISGNSDTQKLVRNLVKKSDKPVVLDADGINAYKDFTDELKIRKAPLVITPHPGEMSRVAKMSAEEIQKDRQTLAKRFSSEYNAVVVLKGFQTVVAGEDELYVNENGNPGMATGGAGDILTGMIASLIGQGLNLFGAAKLASYVHGVAGDLAMREQGEISLIAADILHKLPAAFKGL